MPVIQSAANPLAAMFFVSATLIANCTAQAQTIGNTGGSKRIQVLRIVEVGSVQATSIKKHRWAIAAAKKKMVGRNLVGRTESPAVEAAPAQPISANLMTENALAVHESISPVQNRIAVSSSKSIDTLSFDDRAVAFSSLSSAEDNDISPAVVVTVAAATNRDVNDDIVEKPANMPQSETQQSPVSTPPISPVMAIVGGGLLACGFDGIWSVQAEGESRYTPFDRYAVAARENEFTSIGFLQEQKALSSASLVDVEHASCVDIAKPKLLLHAPQHPS
jgi:hypothetical protein